MKSRNLREFLNLLRREGEVIDVYHPVESHLEIAEIHRRVIAANGPALFFHNVKRKSFPIVTNLFGTQKRVDLAFGQEPLEFVKQAAKLAHTLMPPKLGTLWEAKSTLWKLAKLGRRNAWHSPVKEAASFDATQLPALTSWIEDGGPFLTLPLVHTQSPTNHQDNLGMYRVQMFEPREIGMHFQIGKGGGFHLFEAERSHRPLPANIYLGGPPALILSAVAPLPENIPELILASLLMGGKLPMSKVPESPLPILSEAEFAIVGEVLPHKRRPEGPFGDHYGYYSLQHDYPVLKVHKIYHRKDAIFPATVVGKPRQEDFYLGNYLQELLSPLFPLAMPAVEDLWSYGETGFHALSAAVLKERYHREAMGAVFRILGEGQLSLTKFLLAVDRPMDLKNFKEVLTYVLERVDWAKDLYVFSELSMDTLDYTGEQVNRGSKGVILGMGEPKRKLPREFRGGLPGSVRKACAFSPGCLVLEGASYTEHRSLAAELPLDEVFSEWQLIILVDSVSKALSSESAFLWTTFTRFNPAADINSRSQAVQKNKIHYSGPICIDARMKPWYPKELFCDDETRKLVDTNWKTYFPRGDVQMGSSDLGHL